MRSPIHRITGTAIELPSARYRRASLAGFPLKSMAVQPSGNPWSRSHSRGVRRRTT